MAMFHDDGRFFAEEPRRQDPVVFTLYKTFSEDGGLTWSFPEAVYRGDARSISANPGSSARPTARPWPCCYARTAGRATRS